MLNKAKKSTKLLSEERKMRELLNSALARLERARTLKDKEDLILELHSIIRVLETAQKNVVLDILQDVLGHLRANNDRKAVILVNKAVKLLEKKYASF